MYNKIIIFLFSVFFSDFSIPMVGFGTGGLALEEPMRSAIRTALRTGYRLLDLAVMYHNEEIVRDVLREADTPSRTSLFLTSKVWPTRLGYQETLEEVTGSLARLDTGYL